MEERVQKIIAAAGIASRRAAEQLILDGRVKVNGVVVTELGTKADPEKDHIKVDGKLINPRQPKTYVMLNKPVGYVTTMSDPEGRPVVSSLLQGIRTRVYPVGRLDYNTEGLLLLTNDGDFANLVTHPRHELPKTYLVKVKGALEDRDVENLEQGVFLKDGKTAPARVRRLRKEEANSWVEITIREGRKRQVRRMIDHTGKSVIKLKRTSVGGLELGDLALGAYRHLTSEEVKGLREAAQGETKMLPGESVSVPSGPAGAKRQLTFIEGPKPKKRQPSAAPVHRKTDDRYPAKETAGRRTFRGSETRGRAWERTEAFPEKRGKRPEDRRPFSESEGSFRTRKSRASEGFKLRSGQGRSFGGQTASAGQRRERHEGRRSWQEKRPDRASFRGPEGSPRSRGVRTGEGFRPRTDQGRSFGSRSASEDRRKRPEGKRPWQAARPGSKELRAGAGVRRASGPKNGWSRSGGNRDRKGRGPRRP